MPLLCFFGFHPFERHGIYRICPRCHKAEPALDVDGLKQTLDEISMQLRQLERIREELEILNSTTEKIYLN